MQLVRQNSQSRKAVATKSSFLSARKIVIGLAYAVTILLVLAIAIPSLVPARHYVSQNACINNLRAIDYAKEQWAMANGKTNGEPVVVVEVNRYIKGNTKPVCPGGGTYSYNVVGCNPTCTVTSPTVHILVK